MIHHTILPKTSLRFMRFPILISTLFGAASALGIWNLFFQYGEYRQNTLGGLAVICWICIAVIVQLRSRLARWIASAIQVGLILTIVVYPDSAAAPPYSSIVRTTVVHFVQLFEIELSGSIIVHDLFSIVFYLVIIVLVNISFRRSRKGRASD